MKLNWVRNENVFVMLIVGGIISFSGVAYFISSNAKNKEVSKPSTGSTVVAPETPTYKGSNLAPNPKDATGSQSTSAGSVSTLKNTMSSSVEECSAPRTIPQTTVYEDASWLPKG